LCAVASRFDGKELHKMGKLQDGSALPSPAALPAFELLRIASMLEASKLSGVSERTLRRNFPELIIQISKRRQGMRVRDALLLKQPA
jgi:hypothetical protein